MRILALLLVVQSAVWASNKATSTPVNGKPPTGAVPTSGPTSGPLRPGGEGAGCDGNAVKTCVAKLSAGYDEQVARCKEVYKGKTLNACLEEAYIVHLARSKDCYLQLCQPGHYCDVSAEGMEGRVIGRCCADGEKYCFAGCANVTTDPNNCGHCGLKCGKHECINGKCVVDKVPVPPCPKGSQRCGGIQCLDLQNDKTNCGKCGQPCADGERCQAAKCTGCPAGTTTCWGKPYPGPSGPPANATCCGPSTTCGWQTGTPFALCVAK